MARGREFGRHETPRRPCPGCACHPGPERATLLFVSPWRALSVVGAIRTRDVGDEEAVMIAALSIVLYSFEVDGMPRAW